MQRGNFGTLKEFARHIAELEKSYTERLFHALYKECWQHSSLV